MQDKLKDIIELAPETAHVEPWTSLPEGGIVFVRHPSSDELANIVQLTQSEISETIAPLNVVQRVFSHNPDSFWGVFRAEEGIERKDARFVGYYGLLHLSQAGRDALESNTFDALNPPAEHLVPGGSRPSAIYIWGIVARKHVRASSPLVAWALGHKLYGGVPIYATAGTKGGLSTIKAYGFAGAREAEDGLGHLFRLDPPRKKSAVA